MLVLIIVLWVLFVLVCISKAMKREQKAEAKLQGEEFAKKMAEAKLRKKIEREKHEAELLEQKQKYCIELEQKFHSVGVSYHRSEEFDYDIYAPEDIDVAELFRLLKIINSTPRNFYIGYNFVVIDINQEELIEITEFEEDWCCFVFFARG